MSTPSSLNPPNSFSVHGVGGGGKLMFQFLAAWQHNNKLIIWRFGGFPCHFNRQLPFSVVSILGLLWKSLELGLFRWHWVPLLKTKVVFCWMPEWSDLKRIVSDWILTLFLLFIFIFRWVAWHVDEIQHQQVFNEQKKLSKDSLSIDFSSMKISLNYLVMRHYLKLTNESTNRPDSYTV